MEENNYFEENSVEKYSVNFEENENNGDLEEFNNFKEYQNIENLNDYEINKNEKNSKELINFQMLILRNF